MSNNHCLYKSVSLKTPDDEITKSSVSDEKYGIFYSDDEYNQVLSNNQSEVKLMDENYKEKIMSWLNQEFVQVYLCNFGSKLFNMVTKYILI